MFGRFWARAEPWGAHARETTFVLTEEATDKEGCWYPLLLDRPGDWYDVTHCCDVKPPSQAHRSERVLFNHCSYVSANGLTPAVSNEDVIRKQQGGGSRETPRTVGFAGHAVFMCGCEVLAAIHNHTFNDLCALLPAWAADYVRDDNFYSLMGVHQLVLFKNGVEGHFENNNVPASLRTMRRQIQQQVFGNQHPPDYDLRSEEYWDFMYNPGNECGQCPVCVDTALRHQRALEILIKLMSFNVLGLDAEAFDHMAKWLQETHGWVTDCRWLCIEDPSNGEQQEALFAHWIRFGLEDVIPPRRTGHPGDDWNTCDPRITMHPHAANNTLLHQRVVVLMDSHFRVMPLATTLPGYPHEPQPPRCPRPKGRAPKDTTWNYVLGAWQILQPPGTNAVYDQVLSVGRMIAFAYEQDSEEQYTFRKEDFTGYTHYKWGWALLESSESRT
jgi:hypothetical protein